ncbi:MAG: 50S ribosomal protein L25/general stress protein Ctc [Hyphomicrobiaceae bacterium]|nr:50S ribosomal protein L25/general stress protein Ctc [Hyphomicrobiaceae bacterium]
MAEINELNATSRKSAGKGAARAIRREGRVPAVIYGDNKEPEAISLDFVDVLKAMNTGMFLSTVYDVNIDGGAMARVIPRDIQVDPVKDFPMHVDFLRIKKNARIVVEIAVNFLNEEECPGLKAGGAFNVVRHEIEVSCPADAIPESIDLDVGSLEIGTTLHASDLKLPGNIELTITDRDFSIVSVVGQMAEVAEGAPEVAEESGDEDEGEGEDKDKE